MTTLYYISYSLFYILYLYSFCVRYLLSTLYSACLQWRKFAVERTRSKPLKPTLYNRTIRSKLPEGLKYLIEPCFLHLISLRAFLPPPLDFNVSHVEEFKAPIRTRRGAFCPRSAKHRGIEANAYLNGGQFFPRSLRLQRKFTVSTCRAPHLSRLQQTV